jgi:hypothetical protein
MTKFIFDACSLIYLTKINLKEKLTKLGEVIVSQTVKNELIEEIDQFEDAKILNRNIENKIEILKIKKLRRVAIN